jgi:hypothetical protein
VKTWFQAFAFKWVNLYRYASEGGFDLVEQTDQPFLIKEGLHKLLTHSLKAPGFNP